MCKVQSGSNELKRRERERRAWAVHHVRRAVLVRSRQSPTPRGEDRGEWRLQAGVHDGTGTAASSPRVPLPPPISAHSEHRGPRASPPLASVAARLPPGRGDALGGVRAVVGVGGGVYRALRLRGGGEGRHPRQQRREEEETTSGHRRRYLPFRLGGGNS